MEAVTPRPPPMLRSSVNDPVANRGLKMANAGRADCFLKLFRELETHV
jgi:hypothetical protein